MAVWDVEKDTKLCEINFGPNPEILETSLRDDKLIASIAEYGGQDTVRVVALETGEQLHRLHRVVKFEYCISVAEMSPNMALMAVSYGDVVSLWDVKNEVIIKQFDLGTKDNSINNLEFNPSGDILLVGSQSGDIYKVDME